MDRRNTQGLVALVMMLAGCDPTFGGGGGSARGGGEQAPKGNVIEVYDRNGFEKPVLALTIEVPAGWKAEANIRWDNVDGQCSYGVASPDIVMTSADGREQFAFLPGYFVSNYVDFIVNRGSKVGDYCRVARANSGESLMRDIAIPRLLPGWSVRTVASVTPPRDVQENSDLLRSMPIGDMRITPYAVEAFADSPDGQAVEKMYLAGIVTESPTIIAGVPGMMLNQNAVLADQARSCARRIWTGSRMSDTPNRKKAKAKSPISYV